MAKKQSKGKPAKPAEKMGSQTKTALHKTPKNIVAELTGGPTQPAIVSVEDDATPELIAAEPAPGTAKDSPPDNAKSRDTKTSAKPAQKDKQTEKLPKKPGALVKAFRAIGRFSLRTSVPEILLLISLILSRWLQNSDFSYPQEVLTPIVLFGVLATIIFYL